MKSFQVSFYYVVFEVKLAEIKLKLVKSNSGINFHYYHFFKIY